MLLHAAAVADGARCSPRCGRGRWARWPPTTCCLTAAVFWPRGQLLGANLVRLPAAAAARRRSQPHVRRRPRSRGHAARARPARSPSGEGEFFLRRGEAGGASGHRQGDRAPRPQRRKSQPAPFARVRALWTLPAAARRASRPGDRSPGLPAGRPLFFRAPMGLRSPLLDPVLARCGLRYVSWTRRGLDAIDRNPARVLAAACRRACGGRHPAVARRRSPADSRRQAGRARGPAARCWSGIQAKGLRSVTLPAALDDGTAA